MDTRGHLDTELSLPASAGLDALGIAGAFDVFDEADRILAPALSACRESIVAAIELIVERLGRGGRLIYVGAGTSGRLGLLDAVECPPTFQTDPEQVQGRLAGGTSAFMRSQEGAEDSRAGGARTVDDVTELDVVFGIAAGGTTPFVHGALAEARARGAATVFLACVPRSQVSDDADVSIRLATGPEVLAGSTRLKAGTATKMVLGRVTTIAMAQLGKVHGNRMVDVQTAGNEKLLERGITLIADLTGLESRAEAATLLHEAGGRVKLAVVMHRFGCGPDQARERLDTAGDFLRRALAGS